MGRPPIDPSKRLIPFGPVRVTPEQQRSLERWAEFRGLQKPDGTPNTSEAFRDLARLAGRVLALDPAGAIIARMRVEGLLEPQNTAGDAPTESTTPTGATDP